MRVHYDIPNDVHKRAKMAAAAVGLTLRDFLVSALTEAAAKVEAQEERDRLAFERQDELESSVHWIAARRRSGWSAARIAAELRHPYSGDIFRHLEAAGYDRHGLKRGDVIECEACGDDYAPEWPMSDATAKRRRLCPSCLASLHSRSGGRGVGAFIDDMRRLRS
jgi:hypothetical protein